MYKKSNITLNRYFGTYGGRYVPEMLIQPLDELATAFVQCIDTTQFIDELNNVQKKYNGRPSPLYKADNLTHTVIKKAGLHKDSKIFLKLEHLNHTGAHKMNNALGQALLAKYMGKNKIVAETGAGQHGLATAAACAKLGLDCIIFMGETDVKRQHPNVYAMKLMGAKVVSVKEGNRTLKDAVNAAMKYWIEHVFDTHYILGSALGPFPYPNIVQFFQSIISIELQEQFQAYFQEQQASVKKNSSTEKQHPSLSDTPSSVAPDMIIACVGGGSNAMGIFSSFFEHTNTALLGVEAGGYGLSSKKHAVRLQGNASIGITQGYKSYFLQNKDGQIANTHSISAGLDYSGISPQLAHYYDIGRVHFTYASDAQAIQGYSLLSKTEGIIPALESSHAIAVLPKIASLLKQKKMSNTNIAKKVAAQRPVNIVVNISGRGDKDIFIAAPHIDKEGWLAYLTDQIARHTDNKT